MSETASRRRRDACIYCGEQESLTKDHVPPKALFSKPRPSDLITVPASRPCNKSFEKDDEYLRLSVLTQAEPGRDPGASELWTEKVVRGTLRRSPALKREIIRGIGAIDVTTAAGIYLGTEPTIRLSRRRTDRVTRRIVTALHWHHYGHVPRDGVNFTIAMGPDPKHPGVAERVALDALRGRPWIKIGGGAFRYAHNYFRKQQRKRSVGRTLFNRSLQSKANTRSGGSQAPLCDRDPNGCCMRPTGGTRPGVGANLRSRRAPPKRV